MMIDFIPSVSVVWRWMRCVYIDVLLCAQIYTSTRGTSPMCDCLRALSVWSGPRRMIRERGNATVEVGFIEDSGTVWNENYLLSKGLWSNLEFWCREHCDRMGFWGLMLVGELYLSLDVGKWDVRLEGSVPYDDVQMSNKPSIERKGARNRKCYESRVLDLFTSACYDFVCKSLVNSTSSIGRD